MTREQRLRSLILDRSVSLRKFAEQAGIPYSSLLTILSRGIGGASFDTVLHLCTLLGICPLEFRPERDP